MERVILTNEQKEQLLKYKKCLICRGNIKITIEFVVESLKYISNFKCKRCGISGKLFGLISKQLFDNLTH